MHRLTATALIAVTSLVPTAANARAQTPAATASQATTTSQASIAPPLLPLVTNYHYWPMQFVQFLGTEVPYSLIELDVDPNGKHPLLDVALTERASGKRIHYTDNDGLIASAKALGEEAHKTALAFDPADTENTGSISTLRFTTADGKPLQWRFVQGSDVSEQGSGLNPLPAAKLPIFVYREEAAVAGEGTALQVGDTVSTASVWTEISQPPYFVAYRGALSESAHMLVFMPGKEDWTVAASPAALTAGASWELDEVHGNHRSIYIDKVDGAHITVTSTDRFQPGVRCILDATRIGDGWSFDHVRFAPVRDGEKHFLALQFATPLSSTADNTQVTLLAGKKTIASGAVVASGSAGSRSETLSFSNPAWLNGKTVAVQDAVATAAVASSTHP